MLLKYSKILLACSFFLVSGCEIIPVFYQTFFVSHKVEFSINKLPDGFVNQTYFQKIEIYNSGAIRDKDQIKWEITPENTGLTIKQAIDKNSTNGFYNGVEISGTPKLQGDISIRIYGYGYSGNSFNKTFILKVNP